MILLKKLWREKSLGADTRRVKAETKSVVSEAQARAKEEIGIE